MDNTTMTSRIAVLLVLATIGCATTPESVRRTNGESHQLSIQEQIERLRSWDRRERIRAARVLAKKGRAAFSAVPDLVPLLKDTDLEMLFSYEPGSIPALEAARALEAIADPAAMEALIAALRDNPVPPQYGRSIQAAIVKALGAIGNARAAAPVVELLGVGPPFLDTAVGDALARFGDGAFTPLGTALDSPTIDVRMSAARALGRIGGPRAVDLLITALRKETHDVLSENIAAALGAAGPTAFEPLAAMLSEEPADVRRKAVEALGRLRDRRAVEPLLDSLERDRTISRGKIMLALGRIGDPRALDAFASVVFPSGWLEPFMMAALGEMGDGAVDILRRFVSPDYSGFTQDTLQALESLGKIGTRSAAKALVVALRHGDPSVRRRAAEELGRTGQEAAVQPLATLLADDDPQLRTTAAVALAQIKSPAAADALFPFEGNQTVNASRLLIAALTEDKNGRRDIIALERLLSSHEDRNVRADAATALGSIRNGKVFDPLMKALVDPERKVRGSAAESLGLQGDSRAVAALVRNLGSPDPTYPTKEAEALVKIGASSVEPLVRALSDKSFRDKERVARALGKLRSARATDGLLALLPTIDSGARQSAAWALGEIGETRAKAPLIEILRESTRPTQMVIVDALRKLEGRDYSRDDGKSISWRMPGESPGSGTQ